MAEPIYLEVINRYRQEVDRRSLAAVNDLTKSWRGIAAELITV